MRAANAWSEEVISTTPPASLPATAALSPPKSASPQVTTDPSCLMAAKAFPFATTLTTPELRRVATEELSEGSLGPQVTTAPPSVMAAMVSLVEATAAAI